MAVLLALFDGARFLDAQLESIARQSHRNWSLSIRDDGSRDHGVALARDFATDHPGHDIRVWGGAHRGFARNFLALIEAAEAGADYAAYSDQDDVWSPEKLDRAIAKLSELPAGVPALYCGPTILTDANLVPIGRSYAFRHPPAFRNALVQSIAGGNTMVANRAAIDILRVASSYRGPVPAHDWWTYQVISGVGGTIIVDKNPMVLYRQHGANMIGSNQGTRARLRRLKALANGQLAQWSEQNLAALAAVSPLLTRGNRAVLRDFAELRELPLIARLKRLGASGLHRQTRAGQAALWTAAATARL
ncbi:MAG: glycosyltransferase [Pseudomonadota bacterium]